MDMEKNHAPPPYNTNQFDNPGYGDPYNAGASWQQPPSQPMYDVIVTGGALGGCPICHNNSWTGTYSCCAWLLAIFCFPVGIICCCCMRQKKCTKCGYTVG